MNGVLGEKLLAEIIREIARKNGSGLLRLTQGKAIKAIFFETGNPIFAISNLTEEQLDFKLAKEGYATPEQISEAKQRAGKAHRLGQTLVEMGVITDEVMRRVTRETAMQIIQSLFEWTEGDYVFDQRMRAVHEVKLEISAADCILEGARHAARIDQVSQAVVPDEAVVSRTRSNGSRMGYTGKLNPTESYLLSRIESATPVNELSSITGLDDRQSHEAVCALVSVGLLRVEGKDKQDAENQADSPDDRIADEVSRKLHFFTSADYYEILGVTRRSSSADIKAGYYRLAKRFHPDRYRQPEHKELRSKLEALFARITQAYDTLSDTAQRAIYDDRTKNSSGPAADHAPAEPPTPSSEPRPVQSEPKVVSSEPAANPQPPAPAPASRQSEETASPPPAQPSPVTSPAQAAEHFYQQGRMRYDQKEYYGAVTLLREAVKLDSSKPHYHYHLGVALLRNPRTRREGEHHLVKAAELDPYNSQIRVRLGLLYKEAGLPKKAEHYFREALSLDRDNRAAQRELGASGEKKDAIWKTDLGSFAKKLFKK